MKRKNRTPIITLSQAFWLMLIMAITALTYWVVATGKKEDSELRNAAPEVSSSNDQISPGEVSDQADLDRMLSDMCQRMARLRDAGSDVDDDETLRKFSRLYCEE